ncbi:hypothetical protein D9M69_406550 [compost metagenome]
MHLSDQQITFVLITICIRLVAEAQQAENDPKLPLATGRNRSILLKKSVSSPFTPTRPEKLSTGALLREI